MDLDKKKNKGETSFCLTWLRKERHHTLVICGGVTEPLIFSLSSSITITRGISKLRLVLDYSYLPGPDLQKGLHFHIENNFRYEVNAKALILHPNVIY